MDTKILLKSLNDHKVKFVIIGATAGSAHGHKRFTEDIDIFVEPTQENIEKTFKALQTIGYDLNDVTLEEALEKKLLFRGYILKTDIHPHVKGVEWQNVWNHKIELSLNNEKVYFASLDDLILMKKAAGRPKDLEDLRYLEEIKRQLENKKSNS